MAARNCGAPPSRPDGSARPDCKAAVRAQNRARTDHYADSHARRVRVLNINAVMGVVVCLVFAVLGFWSGPAAYPIQAVNVVTGIIFALVPWLHRFGELVAPLTVIFTAYTAVVVTCWDVGTGGGVQYYLVTTASLVVLQLGIERIGLAALLATLGVALVVMLQFLVPRSTGLEPAWAMTMSFVITTVSACAMVVVTVWFAMRDTERAEAVMEAEHERSEALLGNMLPASVADRLKEPEHDVIADRYEEASVLFADMVGFTERASSTAPCDLVKFLDRVYSTFDELVDKHGLEKSRSAGTPTWWSVESPGPGPIMYTHWPTSPSTWSLPPRKSKTHKASRCPYESALPWAPWSRAWWGRGASSTTCGVTRSMSRPGWNPPTRWDRFKCPRTFTSA